MILLMIPISAMILCSLHYYRKGELGDALFDFAPVWVPVLILGLFIGLYFAPLNDCEALDKHTVYCKDGAYYVEEVKTDKYAAADLYNVDIDNTVMLCKEDSDWCPLKDTDPGEIITLGGIE